MIAAWKEGSTDTRVGSRRRLPGFIAGGSPRDLEQIEAREGYFGEYGASRENLRFMMKDTSRQAN